jgi:cell wall-associated NlpC family hydrolase
MTIDTSAFAVPVPAGVADLEATFASLAAGPGALGTGSASGGSVSGTGSPNDPFAVLLAAESGSSSAGTSTSTSTSAGSEPATTASATSPGAASAGTAGSNTFESSATSGAAGAAAGAGGANAFSPIPAATAGPSLTDGATPAATASASDVGGAPASRVPAISTTAAVLSGVTTTPAGAVSSVPAEPSPTTSAESSAELASLGTIGGAGGTGSAAAGYSGAASAGTAAPATATPAVAAPATAAPATAAPATVPAPAVVTPVGTAPVGTTYSGDSSADTASFGASSSSGDAAAAGLAVGAAAGFSGTSLSPDAQSAIAVAASSPGATPGGVAIVADATRYLGVPYLWGGTSPTTGFDCSGLVQHVFGDLGVTLPRTSYEQVDSGTPVASLADAQPGDLLFFEPGQNGAGPGEPGHVAIYIGDGEMIAAPETGESVQVQQVPTTPMAIRRVAVPSSVAGTSIGSADPSTPATATGTPTTAAANGASTVTMGNVAVPTQYAGLITSAAASSGVPPQLLAAELDTESGFDPNAVSDAGAEGIAQFMPSTAAGLGVQPFDPSSAIPGAADYLGSLENELGSWPLAIAAYNAGPNAVEQSGGIPANGQTPQYVTTVLDRAGMSEDAV